MQAFKQEVPTLHLSVECGTPDVPADGRYHVVHQGHVVFSHKSQNRALERYRQLRDQLAPAATSRTDPSEVLKREREYFEANSQYLESYAERVLKSRRKGGRGGRGGV